MPMRRTVGISLACLVISASAIAKTPERRTSDHPSQPLRVTLGQGEARTANIRFSCNASHARSSARYSAHHGRQVRHRDDSHHAIIDAGGGPPDVYLGQVHATGRTEIGKAAWYGLVGGYTSSGERLDTITATAAHRSLPLASYAKVTNLDSGRSVIVKINDRGPQSRRFIIDLSPRAADEIDMRHAGVVAVIVEPVATSPATLSDAVPTVAAFQSPGIPLAQ